MNDDWMARAGCRGHDPELFFPLGKAAAAQVAKAKRICGACPARKECLEHAVTHHEYAGLWGGLTEDERAPLDGRLVPAPGQSQFDALLDNGDRLRAFVAEGLRPKDIAYRLDVTTQSVSVALERLGLKTTHGPTATTGRAA